MEEAFNPEKVLNVSSGVAQSELFSAYMFLSQEYHPVIELLVHLKEPFWYRDVIQRTLKNP